MYQNLTSWLILFLQFRSLFFGASQASTQSQTQRTTSAQLSTSRVLAEDTDDDDWYKHYHSLYRRSSTSYNMILGIKF